MNPILPVRPNHRRQWCRCRTCGRIQYYDYLPFSLQKPIMVPVCGHGASEHDYGLDCISADEALVALSRTNP
jgi:hypothetical protein